MRRRRRNRDNMKLSLNVSPFVTLFSDLDVGDCTFCCYFITHKNNDQSRFVNRLLGGSEMEKKRQSDLMVIIMINVKER